MHDLRSHHVGVLVKDIDLATADYVSNLGYEVKSDTFHDPTQAAFVRFLKLPGESVLLELISPDGPQSHLASALKKGGGINHLCYEVIDIEDTLRCLRNREFLTLQEPVAAVAFKGRRIAWLMNRHHMLIELVEKEASLNGSGHLGASRDV